jgi:hypothetical protein
LAGRFAAPGLKEIHEEEGKREVMMKWLAIGVVAALLLAGGVAITVWPTFYRYEVKHRCDFKANEPYENPHFGETGPYAERGSIKEFMQRRYSGAKRWIRHVMVAITDEQYKIHRISGDIYRLEKGQWVLQGRLFERPQEFMDGYNGKTPEGCRRDHSGTQHGDSYDGPWEEFKEQ